MFKSDVKITKIQNVFSFETFMDNLGYYNNIEKNESF